MSVGSMFMLAGDMISVGVALVILAIVSLFLCFSV